MNVGPNLYQSTTGSCTIAALSNTIAMMLKFIFHVIVLPAHIFSSLISMGLPLSGIYCDLLPFIALASTVIFKQFGAVTFKIRVTEIGSPKDAKIESLAKMVNSGECFVFGWYFNKVVDEVENNNNSNNNDINHNHNNSNNNNNLTTIQKLLIAQDTDGSHAIAIERIRRSFCGDFIAFCKESEHDDFAYIDMNINIFAKLYIVEVSDFAVHREVAANIYNEKNWSDDERDTILWPGIFSQIPGDHFQRFIKRLIKKTPNYNNLARVKSMISSNNSDDISMSKWTQYVSQNSLFQHNIFVKCSVEISRTILLLLVGFNWINLSIVDLNSYKRLKNNIFDKQLKKRGNGKCDDDIFTKHVTRKYRHFGKYNPKADEIKNCRALYVADSRSYLHCNVVRGIFTNYIWTLFESIGILQRFQRTSDNAIKFTLNNYAQMGPNWIKKLKGINYIIPGWSECVDIFEEKIKIYDNNAFINDNDRDFDKKLFEKETKKFNKQASICFIPPDIKLPFVQSTTPSDQLKKFLVNRQSIDAKKLFDLKNSKNVVTSKITKRKRIKWDTDIVDDINDMYYVRFMYGNKLKTRNRKRRRTVRKTLYLMRIKTKFGNITKLL